MYNLKTKAKWIVFKMPYQSIIKKYKWKNFLKFLTHPKNLCLWKPFKNKLENTKHAVVKVKIKRRFFTPRFSESQGHGFIKNNKASIPPLIQELKRHGGMRVGYGGKQTTEFGQEFENKY